MPAFEKEQYDGLRFTVTENPQDKFAVISATAELKDGVLSFTQSNPDIFSVLGYSKAESESLSLAALLSSGDMKNLVKTAEKSLLSSSNSSASCCLTQKNGQTSDFIISMAPAIVPGNGIQEQKKNILFLHFINLTPLHFLTESLENNNIQRNFISDILQLSIFEYDYTSRKILLSRYPYNMSSKNQHIKEETISETIDHINIHPDDKSKSEAFFEKLKTSTGIHSEEIRLLSEDGIFYWVKISAKTFFANGSPKKSFGCIMEIEKQKRKELQEENEKQLDPLTRLLNQNEIQSAVISELNTRLEIRRDALIILNFDNLYEINEKLGHVFGDEIIIFAAEKISKICKKINCLMGRIANDEFLLFFKDIKNDSDLQDVLSKITDQIQKIYVGEIGISHLSVSVGAVINSGETDLKTLLEKAHKTIYLQKISGNKKNSMFYSQKIEEKILTTGEKNFYRIKSQNSDISSETGISEMLLDILSRTKDLDSAVNLSIMKIGILYNLASVRILELNQDGGSMKIQKTYDWASDTEYKDRSSPIKLTHQEILSLQSTDEIILWPQNSTTENLPQVFRRIYPWMQDFSFAQNKIYNEGKFFGFVLFLNKDTGHIWSKQELSTLRTLSKILSGYMLQIRAFNRAEILVKKLSQIDSLTGFYHYDDFRQNAIEILANDGGKNNFIISALDIRGFKYINEFYGYKSGNLFLKSVADFISESPYFESGCRMLSDIFLILSKVPKNATEKTINETILRNIDVFLEKQMHRYPRCNLRIVSGTCKIILPEIDVQKAMDNANSLRKELKTLFKNRSKIYSGVIAEKLEFKKHLTNSLPSAFAHHEFLFYLQPKVSLATGTIAGAEALVRWNKDGKILLPNDFIPSLEENGLITMIDFYIYESVCKYISYRLREKKPVVPISVNVSGHHLLSSEFLSKLLPLIKRYEIPSEFMEFELTETTFLDNLQTASQIFSTLQQEGFKISIDDFGSGYSSTTLLKELPFDIVKMDKNFLARNKMNEKDKIVLSCIIDMAKKLDIKVLCEGAETKEQVDFLKNAGCDIIQGFYFSQPLPVEDFNRLIEENHVFPM